MSTVPSPWSSKSAKATPVFADQLLLLDSEDGDPLTQNKRVTFASILASITQKTNNATGFSLAGGSSSSKTLTVTADSTIDQNLSSASTPVFAGAYLSGELRVRDASDSSRYLAVFYSTPDNATYFQSATSTDYIWGASGGALHTRGGFVASNISSWIGGSFGTNSTAPRVVAGMINGGATIGAHNFNFSAWLPLFIQNGGVEGTGIGLNSLTQTVNATLHGAGTTILGTASSAIADGSIYNNQTNFWADATNVDLVFKQKNNSGVIQNFYGLRKNFRTITANDTNVAGDDFIFIDTTLGDVLLTVDVTKIGKTGLTIVNYQGVGLCQFQSDTGQFIDGVNTAFTITTNWSSRTIEQTPSSINGFISATKGT